MMYKISSEDFGKDMLKALTELEATLKINLTKFQKILLAEIGTVEQVLSIIAGSAIVVEVIKQELKGDKVDRDVKLKDTSGNELIYAKTLCDIKLMPQKVVSDLLNRRGGIGTILSRYGIETTRRIIDIGYDSAKQILSRNYVILHAKKVWFTIHEEFSMNSFV